MLYLIVWIDGDKPRGTVSFKTLNEEIPIFNLAVEDTTLLLWWCGLCDEPSWKTTRAALSS